MTRFRSLLSAILLAGAASVSGQSLQSLGSTPLLPCKHVRSQIFDYIPSAHPVDSTVQAADSTAVNSLFFVDEPVNSAAPSDFATDKVYVAYTQLPAAYLRPAVFDKLHLMDTLTLGCVAPVAPIGFKAPGIYKWLNEDALRTELVRRSRQHFMVYNPQYVNYIESLLPEPPRKFTATVDPETARIVIAEAIPTVAPNPELKAKFAKRHWVHAFNVNLQFSQAYVSPNWYQGGTSNLNGLFTSYYNVKLNSVFHPKWLFDVTTQYKLGVNNAPEDEIRDYSISEDLFQVNLTAGYKANRRWYYSMNGQFKTQFLNNYKTNTTTLKAAFMSPGELNVGAGMTYNYANQPKTVTFDASINPASWNYKTCFDTRMNPASFGIKEGYTISQVGSSAEGRLTWKISDNINLRSRLFVFTNYEDIQGDWENTLMFTINRYLTTQIYAHWRYDSSTKYKAEFEKWRKMQMKEVLSFGFTYKFNS